jgi:primase-polymerase (primpol)-like protein
MTNPNLRSGDLADHGKHALPDGVVGREPSPTDFYGVEPPPGELVELRQWVAWCLEQRDGKLTKVPYRPTPRKGARASTTDSATWGSYEDAETARSWATGVGFVFSADDPYCGVDLDACRDPKTGLLAVEAAAIVQRLDSYCEWSQSGLGVHVILKAVLPGDRRRRGSVEIYDRGRYFCMTSRHVAGTPAMITARQDALVALYERLFPRSPAVRPARITVRPLPGDRQLIERGLAARNGARFASLWAGEWQSGYRSQSEADAALCSMLAFWTHADPVAVDRLFRQSGLMREKWMRADYRTRTIRRAVAHVADRWPGQQ